MFHAECITSTKVCSRSHNTVQSVQRAMVLSRLTCWTLHFQFIKVPYCHFSVIAVLVFLSAYVFCSSACRSCCLVLFWAKVALSKPFFVFSSFRLKYSISIVADKGLKKSLYTSARLKKGEVIYLETHFNRYKRLTYCSGTMFYVCWRSCGNCDLTDFTCMLLTVFQFLSCWP